MILLNVTKAFTSRAVSLRCARFVQRTALDLHRELVGQFPDTLTGDLRLRDPAHADALGAVELSESRAAPRFTARALCARRSGQDAQHERQAHIHPALQENKKM